LTVDQATADYPAMGFNKRKMEDRRRAAAEIRAFPPTRDRGTESVAMSNLAIDWASVNWPYVILLGLFARFCTLIGNVVAFKRTVLGAVLSTLLFTAGFFFWTYYPHNLPLPTSPVGKNAGPRGTAAERRFHESPPAKPNNPVRDITSPSTGVH
jgi:hypothetical protein